MSALVERIKSRLRRPSSPAEAARSRARRHKLFIAKGAVILPYIQLLLAIVGYLQFLAIPLPLSQLARKSFIDENAFQPGQVNTYFSWSDVSAADRYAEALQNPTIAKDSASRSQYILASLLDQGLPASIQEYQSLSNKSIGYNTYARLRAPKTTGSEVLVVCAPWQSREPDMNNIRGIATLLAMAKQLQKLSMWSKDIILLFSDGEAEGLQRWLQAYHGMDRVGTESLTLGAGSIWGAIVLDYPYHSFSHLGLYYDGVNGRLPNLDVVHGAAHIAKWVGGVPVRLHNQTHMEASAEESFANGLERYQQRAKGILQQVAYSATTLPSGAEGLFAQFGIDSIGFFAVPAEGPHGFYTIGRVVESMLRAFNNLTERLHASFFLYLLPEPFQFLSVATYLSAPILIAAALTIAGLRLWRRETSTSDLQLVLQLTGSYIFGGILLWLDSSRYDSVWISAALAGILASNSLVTRKSNTALLAINCLITGMVISVLTILNYGLGTLMALLCGTPSLLAVYTASSKSVTSRLLLHAVLVLAAGLVIRQVTPHRAAFDYIPGIAPAVLYLAVVPAWLQL